MRFPILAAAVFSIFLAQSDSSLRIESPSENKNLSGSVEIRGTAAAPGMTRYRVDFAYQQNPTNTWFPIAEGTDSVQNGVLAEWDTTAVSEGNYSLRLSAYLQDGSVHSVTVSVVRVLRAAAPAPAPSPSGEIVIPFQPDAQTARRAAAVFPAPTAVFASVPPQAAPNFTYPAGTWAIGAGAACAAFGLAGLLGLVKKWRRRRFVGRYRENERNHG
jgi:hypothetical protein